ncbi:serpin-ZX-like [Ipomoea triloba]|uniref:serpin-ZX-like n=1 Tax=Ipomoea triloba TaxID=35885 RepID=UPI00125DB658|nr:serpin-ZX-like [Ipomoea triloba]
MDVNRESIKNQVDLSLKLANHIFSTEAGGDSNLVFSPLSINVILSLIAVGSDSPTRDQLLAFLKSDSTDDLNTFYSQIVGYILVDGSLTGGPSLSVANGLWMDRTLPIKPSFKHVVDTVYKAASESVDFRHKASQVVDEVNLWVEKKTKSRINHILPPSAVNNRTRLLFTSALYFNGAWREFDASMTKDHEFHLLNGSSIQVPFMSNYLKQSVKAFSGFKVLKLSYNRGNDYKERRSFSMSFFLPDAMDGLPSLLEKTSSESSFIERHLPTHMVSMGKFLIPKFQIYFQFEGSRVLEELGVVTPFNPTGGGLTEMVDSPEGSELYVSKILHGSFIEVNEGGTEAVGVSFGVMYTCCMVEKEDKTDFVADHPFLFAIREDFSGAILFVGTVLHPHYMGVFPNGQ